MDLKEARALKGNIHATFDTVPGQEVLAWLEKACGWYTSVYDPDNPEMTLINDGKRQVLATIKTFMELSPEQIVELVKQKE